MTSTTLEQTGTEAVNICDNQHNAIYEDMVSRFDDIQKTFRKGEYPTARDLIYMLQDLKGNYGFLDSNEQRNMFRDMRAVLLCNLDAKAKNNDDWDFNSGYELLEKIRMRGFEYKPVKGNNGGER